MNKYDVNTPFEFDASAETRRRYQREVVLFEQRAEAALFLHAGTLAGLRAQSAPDTDSGRRARRLWLFHAYQYVEMINPAPAEYLEDADIDGLALFATHGDEVTAADDIAEDIDSNSLLADCRELLKDRRIAAAAVLLLGLGAAIGWELVQIFAH